MEPQYVADVYLQQANLLYKFISKVNEENLNQEELKKLFLIVAQKYYELLLSLAIYTPLLASYKVKFYTLGKSLNLEEPPFEKDFFNDHKI